MAATPRTGAERKADTLARLEAHGADAWVATASSSGVAHLVPLSYSWNGRDVILAAQPRSLTVRNVQASRRARLAFGATRDVVLVDAEFEAVIDRETAPSSLADAYALQAEWDPRHEAEPYVYLVLWPRRIQAWREANELDGRALMRDGAWLF